MERINLNREISFKRYQSAQNVFIGLTNISYAVLKGEPLSMLCYGEFGKRRSSDIDILIRREDIRILENILIENGFETTNFSRQERITMLSGSHQMNPWKKKIGDDLNLSIDINFDIFWGEYEGNRISIDDMLSNTLDMDIYGCKVKTLQPQKAMIHLLLHHYKEMNSLYHLTGSHSYFHTNLFRDVYYLWANNKDTILWEELYSIGTKYNILPYFYYVLYFTNYIFRDEELEKVIEKFKTSFGVFLLDCYGLTKEERKFWKCDFNARLNAENLYDLIKSDLTEQDFKKIERNKKIFE